MYEGHKNCKIGTQRRGKIQKKSRRQRDGVGMGEGVTAPINGLSLIGYGMVLLGVRLYRDFSWVKQILFGDEQNHCLGSLY